MPKNVQMSIDKWKRNMSTAGEAVKAGVMGMTEAPGVKAAASKDKYVRGVMDAANSGAYEAGQLSYSLQDYKDAVTGKGISNMQTGAQKLSARAQRNMADQLNYANQVADQVAGMPTNTLEDGIAKAAETIRLMAAGRKNRR